MFGGTAERGVSPVIGIIPMVAITVLLAATAATFFLGFENECPERGHRRWRSGRSSTSPAGDTN
ncbi:MAG: archaellin/type IV pilin N-terminal domain-containing protein [Halosimplex sp.]